MSLFPMFAPTAFKNANSVLGPNKSYAINGGVTNVDGVDLLHFLAMGFTPVDDEISPITSLLNRTNVKLLTSSYTIIPTDLASVLAFDNSSDITLTIPKHADLPLVTGATITFCCLNTGKVTLSPATGVTLVMASGLTGVLSGAASIGQMMKVDESRWLVFGGVS